MFFVYWALAMYVVYVASVVVGDGFTIPFLKTLFPGGGTSKLGGTAVKPGFDWNRFRDTLLRR